MLIELLMAMFILALGLSAIAAIFPVAGYLQKQTFNDAVGQQVKNNVSAILQTVQILNSSLTGIANDQHVYPVPSSILQTSGRLPLAMRCYPSEVDLDGDGVFNESGDESDYTKREFYWVPLVQDTDADSGTRKWSVFVFILAKQPNTSYAFTTAANPDDGDPVPKVVSATVGSASGYDLQCTAPGLQVGDQILADNGMTMAVTEISGGKITVNSPVSNTYGSPTKIWYGRALTGQSSPTVNILVMGSEAVQ